ncbi:MAG: elongation factor P maturation arginine rhamnosyltransferase EarP [Alcaligenaceae bacterium]|nr:elongation factor P maturation arginine rhamnosyltransferase EarP [Alcaligenaceae bacterium]
MSPSFDIFCKVVDNYGDIGVCWRLARRLAAHPGSGAIRLWVDDLLSFARIAPQVQPDAATQTVAGVTIVCWNDAQASAPAQQPADIVIEAFACSPPARYIQNMSDQQLWINLEYLSAQDWVESCHGLPSLQPNGLRKFFFFPGFTPATGGLLREPDLLARRDAFQVNPQARLALLAELGVSPEWLELLADGAALIYVFCYPQAPLPALLQALGQHERDALVLMPKGMWPRTLADSHRHGNLIAIHQHDFVDQSRFDQLLWSSDLNIVRGEDSLVRAIWAGRAMMWQPYIQEEDAHLDKLDAWLARSPYPDTVQQAMRAWNRNDGGALAAALQHLLPPASLQKWTNLTLAWSAELAQADDLAQSLLSFYANNHQTR